jgi:ABC-type multidrug transport system fused ATPase/permease subunit
VSTLPVASAAEVRTEARRIALRDRRRLAAVVGMYALAAACGLVAPRVLGDLLEDVAEHHAQVGRAMLVIVAFVAAQAALLRFALQAAAELSEKVLAELRESFVSRVLALPLATVERGGTGDLVTRTTRDVDVLSRSVRLAVPDTLAALTTIVITLGGLLLVTSVLALPCLVAVPLLWASTRWFLRRAREGYLRAGASYAGIAETLGETVTGARTVEALSVGDRRAEAVADAIAASYAAERYTLRLRTVYLPIADVSYILPTVATLVVGGLLYLGGTVGLAEVTTAVLYVQQLIGPVDRMLFWTNELQMGGASLARMLGVRGSSEQRPRLVTAGRPRPHRPEPAGFALSSVSFAYREGRDVVHDLTLTIRSGEHLAVVGPTGAGKSTLGMLLAAIHPPRSGAITLDGIPLADIPFEELRGQVALVTQEHHVFHGTLRDNLCLAKPGADDAELEAALRAVDAWEWVAEAGLGVRVGPGGTTLSPAQVQQTALARLILADPHTLVLDEATSLLAPRAARRLERSLARVLDGRTVIAVAHRLHTAHDADRVVVMNEGRITETGSHDELMEKRGEYAALWWSWQGQ